MKLNISLKIKLSAFIALDKSMVLWDRNNSSF